MDNDKKIELLTGNSTSIEHDAPGAVFIEQYKIYLDNLDRLADRRQTASTFYLSLNTGLCALFGIIFSKDSSPDFKPFSFIVPIAGILISFFWRRLVLSYKQLSSGKFAVLHEFEKHLPASPYGAEWKVLGEGKDPKKYCPLMLTEIRIPLLFIGLYVLLLCYLVYKSPFIDILKKLF